MSTTNGRHPRPEACPYCGASIAGGSALREHLPCDAVPATQEVVE